MKVGKYLMTLNNSRQLFISPTCEIITIGSELLLGQILDTNTTYLAQELGRIGITIRFRTAVGDEVEEIVEILKCAVERCDMVIATGGLGPTLDDLTREAVARMAGVELEFRQDLMDQIEEIFKRAGYQMPDNNRRQAFVPAGSQAISNPVGTAPGFILKVNERPIICLPGVPRELKYLMSREILPWLHKKFHLGDHRITYKVLKSVGMGESSVDRMIGDLMGPEKNPEVGLLASLGEIKIRITATARDGMEAQDLIRPVEDEIRSRLGEKIYGEDDDTLEGVIEALLSKEGLTLAILETFSGGLVAQRLNQLPSNQLIESHIIPHKERVTQWLGRNHLELEDDASPNFAWTVKEMGKAGIGLAILGFPETTEKGYALNGYTAVAGEGIEKSFSWQMGGDHYNLQQRGAVIGLNILRLALLEAKG